MTKEEERKKIVEAIMSHEPITKEEVIENLEDAGFEFKEMADEVEDEVKSKKKANI